jgi:hypothetical protein
MARVGRGLVQPLRAGRAKGDNSLIGMPPSSAGLPPRNLLRARRQILAQTSRHLRGEDARHQLLADTGTMGHARRLRDAGVQDPRRSRWCSARSTQETPNKPPRPTTRRPPAGHAS